MYLKQHIIFGIFFATGIFFLFPRISFLGVSIILLSSVLIDVDHYFFYIYKKEDFNLKRAYNWFIQKDKSCRSLPWEQRENLRGAICILHGIEVLTILILLSFIFNYLIFVFAGFAFHLLLDSIEQTTYWNKMDKVSLVYDLLKNNKK